MEKPLSLTIYQVDKKSYVSACEVFEIILPYSSSYYSTWIKLNITNQPQGLPEKGTDYLLFSDINGVSPKKRVRGGQRRVDYLLSPLFAVQLCYQAKTLPAKNLKKFLYRLIEK